MDKKIVGLYVLLLFITSHFVLDRLSDESGFCMSVFLTVAFKGLCFFQWHRQLYLFIIVVCPFLISPFFCLTNWNCYHLLSYYLILYQKIRNEAINRTYVSYRIFKVQMEFYFVSASVSDDYMIHLFKYLCNSKIIQLFKCIFVYLVHLFKCIYCIKK